MLTVGLQFLFVLLLSAWVGKEVWGNITLMVANSALFLIISSWGADVSLVWHGATGKSSHVESLGLAYLTIAKQLIIYLIILIFYIYFNSQLPLSKMKVSDWYYELLFILGLILTDRYSSLFYARQMSEQCNKMMAALVTVSILIIYALHFSGAKLAYSLQEIYCIIILLQAIVLMVYFHLKTKILKASIPKGVVRVSFYKFSSIVFFTNLIQFLAYRIDYWIVNYLIGTAALGIYSQACRLSQLIWFLPQAIASVLMQTLLSMDGKSGEVLVWKLIKSMLPLLFILSIPLILITKFLFTGILKDFYIGWAGFIILLPGSLMFCISILTASFFSAKRLIWVNLLTSSFCLIMVFILDVILIPIAGIKGAALASSLSYGFSGIFSWIIFSKFSSTKINEVSARGFLKNFMNGMKWSYR